MNLDKKIEKLGYTKTSDNEYGIYYEKYVETYKYTHIVAILNKASGRHILQSYDKDCICKDVCGNAGVGLTYEEMRIFTKKMKQSVRKWKRQERRVDGSD